MVKSINYTIAVVGPASVSKKAITALLDDYLGGNDANFIIPVTEALWNSTIRNVAEYAINRQSGLAVVTDDTTDDIDDDRALEIVELAQTNTKVQRVVQKLVNEVAKAEAGDDKGVLLIAFDSSLPEGDEDFAVQMLAMTAADAKGLTPLDLADALEEMVWDDEDDKVEAPPAPEPERPSMALPEPEPEPVKATPRKRAAAKPVEEVVEDEAPAKATAEEVAAHTERMAEPTAKPLPTPKDLARQDDRTPPRSPLSEIVNPMYSQVSALVDLIADVVAERVHQKLKSEPVPAAVRPRGRPAKARDEDDE